EDISDTHKIRVLTALRKELSMTEAAAALETAILRKKAVDKFGIRDAPDMFFTRGALEQASDASIRNYRAVQLVLEQSGEPQSILDVCCSIGSDALAFAQGSKNGVTGLDIDPVRVRIAQMNAAVLDVKNVEFRVADVREGIPDADFVFFDPARRTDEGKRVFNVERYEPPLSLISQWTHIPRMAVKLAPGVDLEQIAPYGGSVEFISVDGDLKEAVLWRGFRWQGARATLIRGGTAYHLQQHENAEAGLDAPRGWLCEPDPSVLRAGLVQGVAANLNGAMLDETIAYFTSAEKPTGEWAVWVRAWKILDWMPFNLKKLVSYLRAEGVGQVTIKKRGVPMTPDELLPRMKLEGDLARTLVLTRYNGEAIVMICEDYQANA
ncbi:MAG: class I SAM-dependent methyltransferase, partial [Anaerolineae bacterium]